MRPAIRSGDAIVVGVKEARTLAPDEIAVYEHGGLLYAHRFVGWTRDASGRPALGFRGDACDRPDPPIAPEALIGSVIRVEPSRRRFRPPAAAGILMPILAAMVAFLGPGKGLGSNGIVTASATCLGTATCGSWTTPAP